MAQQEKPYGGPEGLCCETEGGRLFQVWLAQGVSTTSSVLYTLVVFLFHHLHLRQFSLPRLQVFHTIDDSHLDKRFSTFQNARLIIAD